MVTKEQLIAFEQEVARRYEAGDIKAPVHLSGGAEDQLIKIFQEVAPDDWVLSTWRNHYHALLHGVPPDDLMSQILRGRSMFINDNERHFYASSIAGGVLPIAVGLGMAIKRRGGNREVWCFVGDMVSMTGTFEECTRYALNFKLPVTFVVEDNSKSVQTVTRDVWGVDCPAWQSPRSFLSNCMYYQYKLTWPHHGTGVWVSSF